MVLEEVILHLLSFSGYEPILTPDGGRTTRMVGAGIAAVGRGADHQIDAIANYSLTPPFGHPLRLLLEAKCWSDKVKLPEIRNAVGVLKDLNERWKGRSAAGGRFHYQYAYFSASDYTSEAINYAFAQDIYLVPLGHSAYLRGVVSAISGLRDVDFPGSDRKGFVGDLRRRIRHGLTAQGAAPEHALEPIFLASIDLAFGLLAISRGGFPLFLSATKASLRHLSPAYSFQSYPDPFIARDLTVQQRENLLATMLGQLDDPQRVLDGFWRLFIRYAEVEEEQRDAQFYRLLRRYEAFYERLFSNPELLKNPTTKDRWIWFNLLPASWEVRIHYHDQQNWFLSHATGEDERRIFSFDLPELLFRKYRQRATEIPQERAFHLKRAQFSAFHAFLQCGSQMRIVQLRLDEDWLTAVQRQFEQQE